MSTRRVELVMSRRIFYIPLVVRVFSQLLVGSLLINIGHAYCKNCTKRWSKERGKSSRLGRSDPLPCPTCRCEWQASEWVCARPLTIGVVTEPVLMTPALREKRGPSESVSRDKARLERIAVVRSRTGQPAPPSNRPPCKIVNNIIYTLNCDKKVKIALNSILLKLIN